MLWRLAARPTHWISARDRQTKNMDHISGYHTWICSQMLSWNSYSYKFLVALICLWPETFTQYFANDGDADLNVTTCNAQWFMLTYSVWWCASIGWIRLVDFQHTNKIWFVYIYIYLSVCWRRISRIKSFLHQTCTKLFSWKHKYHSDSPIHFLLLFLIMFSQRN